MPSIILPDYRPSTRFEPERFSPVPIAQTNCIKVVLTCFEPDQYIPIHQPAVDMGLVILEGEAEVVAGENEATVGPGAVIVVPAGEARGVRARTRLVAIHVVSPPPTEADHAAVQAGLQHGTWR